MATYPVRTRRWTRAEYDRLIDVGMFLPDEPLELLGGELVVSEPQGSAHYTAIGLVAEDRGGRERVIAVDEVEIAVAHAARDGAHEHLASDRLRDLNVLDGEGFVGTVKYRGFHGQLLSRGRRSLTRIRAPGTARSSTNDSALRTSFAA